MAASVTTDFTAPYNVVETFVYDRIIADAVMKFANDFLDEFVQELPQGAKVLEVGCGGGQVAAVLLQRRNDLELTGLDLADDQVKRARKRCPEATFVQGSALELPFDDDQFDGVFSIASIKHWPDQRQGVSECVRVLRPGGRLIIAEADRACTLDEARNFVSNWHIPQLTRPIAMTLFRTFVAGQAIDPIEAQQHLDSQPLEETQVRRQPGLPSLAMIGVKTDSTSSNT